MASITTFEDLECYKVCKSLRQEISDLTKTIDSNEKFRLVDQMLRCSRSVTNNIAEGYGRFHFKENAQFCRQSRGSLYELQDHLSIALDEKYIDNFKYEELKRKIENCNKILNGYIKYLISQTNNK
jgi:four helix bundle protein